MLTTAQPIVEIAKDTYEIDEFDCGSIFVLVGKDKAMVIDTGTGIGDLPAVIRKITDKPIVLVNTHGQDLSLRPGDGHPPLARGRAPRAPRFGGWAEL